MFSLAVVPVVHKFDEIAINCVLLKMLEVFGDERLLFQRINELFAEWDFERKFAWVNCVKT